MAQRYVAMSAGSAVAGRHRGRVSICGRMRVSMGCSLDSILGQQAIHVIADAIAEVVADAADGIQAVMERRPGVLGQCPDDLE
jgi:hypothetical protein